MSDILPTAKKDYDSLTVDDNVNPNDGWLYSFNSKGFNFTSVEPISRRMFPDRFGPDTTQTFKLMSDLDTLLYHKWIYKDSVKVMNSFYNWIDCFGEKCNSFYLGEEKNYQKNATLILVSDTSIILVEGKQLNFNKWYDFHDSLGYQKDWIYTVEQRYRGKARWYKFENEKKIKYE